MNKQPEIALVELAMAGPGKRKQGDKKPRAISRSTDVAAVRDVLLPHIRPALVAGALLAFTLSLDDFVITFFTSGPDTITFPVKVYSMVRFSVTPEVNAASTILILLTVILTFIALKLQGVKGIAETH